MDTFVFGKKIISQLLVMIFILSGCMPSDVPSTTKANQYTKPGSCLAGQNCATNGTTEDTTNIVVPPKVEIRHLIEPNLSTDPTYTTNTGYGGGGGYVRKLTLPKNFAGRLYVAGINIGSLASRITKVRFKFGMNRESVTIPATVSQAPGITPQTQISVLVMDLRSEPFRNIRLPYDLYDYNDYLTNPDGSFKNEVEPTQDNRNSGLYCRGLRIEDDPTFQGVGACDGAQTGAGQTYQEECLYAYAKVLDQGLIKKSGSVFVPLTPSFPQIKSVTGSNYFQDYMSYKLMKPLPDEIPFTVAGGIRIPTAFHFSEAAFPAGTSDSVDVVFNGTEKKEFLGSEYYYRGPYRLVNSLDWQFKFTKLDGPKRLFRENAWVDYDPANNSDLKNLPDDTQHTQRKLYFKSYMFPLATKLDLTADVFHLSSEYADGVRTPRRLPAPGKTLWMDGSNARAQSKNYDLEHIGSCNVTASIEIIAKDDKNIDFVVSTANDVKLQLVRPTQYRTDIGNEVLYSNFKSCTNNAGCGGSECCFNNRCWDQALVSQCMDNTSNQGNKIIGESCATDLECTSLCCNRTTGQCAPHNSIVTPAVLCSKPIGDYCIAKEWCQKSTVTKCLIVRTGTNPQGETTCRQHCYNTEEYGDCKNGVCIPPVQTVIAPFDPDADGACDNAVPAPKF